VNHVVSFAFIGGDPRQLPVIRQLSDAGHEIRTFGLEQAEFANPEIQHCQSIAECITQADVVALPLPYSTDSEWILTKLSNRTVSVKDVIDAMDKKQLLLAGRADSYLKALAELHHIRLVDYMQREELSVLNTVPTVEGAIAIAMEQTPYTIHQSRCLVLGYGRIGKLLSHSLQALGAVVHVSARKHSDLAWIKAYAMTGIHHSELESVIGNYDIIFNTVPSMILDFPMLAKIPPDCLIIDLASSPGGVDFKTAKDLGKTVLQALSLPGKVAPETAGTIIKDTIVNILEELGV